MRKILPILAILLLFTNAFGSIMCSSKEYQYSINSLKESISISAPVIKNFNDRIDIELENCTYYTQEDGNPIIPYITKNYSFPIGTTISDIDIQFDPYHIIYLSKSITLAPEPRLLSDLDQSDLKKDMNKTTYENDAVYPMIEYQYSFNIGIENNNHVMYLLLRIYPIKYSKINNILYYSDNINISINYKIPENIFYFPDIYDMVIITPKEFKSYLNPLIKHKNNFEVKTYIVTLDEIYSLISSGRDNQERIKLYIKNAIEDFGIKYVLLVGGRKAQQKNWFLPVRYSNLDDYSDFEYGYISDLYYSDVYKYDENNGFSFDDWDSNGNNVFAEWDRNSSIKDYLDLFPDVYIGRLACRNKIEVINVVDKIINYEEKSADLSWFNRMIVVAGDTFPNSKDEYEGEIETSRSSGYLEKIGFNIKRLYVSDDTLKRQKNVIDAICNGAGFIHFAGHGNPSVWSTHPPNNYTWIDGLYTYAMNQLKNRFKLPICVVGGCHNSQINVTVNNIIEGIRKDGLKYFSGDEYNHGDFWRFEWMPECWSWKFISTKASGAIATIGNTGLGYGYAGNYTLQGLGGWIEPRFFYNYAEEKKDILGETHCKTIIDYLIKFDVNNDRIDRKTVEQWILLGDPSLKIGGYN